MLSTRLQVGVSATGRRAAARPPWAHRRQRDGGQAGVAGQRGRRQDLLRLQAPAVAQLAAPADLQLAQRTLARAAQPVHEVGRTARVYDLRSLALLQCFCVICAGFPYKPKV